MWVKKKNNKQFIKIIIFAILFVLLTPLIVNFIVETPNPFGLGFINDSNKDTWIAFFGSIIGGGATLTGVYITIKAQEDQRRKDLAIQYKPCLVISCSPKNFDSYPSDFLPNYKNHNQQFGYNLGETVDINKTQFVLGFCIFNIGTGIARTVNIDNISLGDETIYDISNPKNPLNFEIYPQHYIEFYLFLGIQSMNDELNNLINQLKTRNAKNNSIKQNIYVTFSYKNEYSNKKITQKYILKYDTLEIDKNNMRYFFKYNGIKIEK